MACEFPHVRKVAIAALPDADPNVTPPLDADLIKLNLAAPNSPTGFSSGALAFYFFCDDFSPGTVTRTVWLRDEGTGRWVVVPPAATVADHLFQVLNVLLGAVCFVQITAVAGFTGTDVITRASER